MKLDKNYRTVGILNKRMPGFDVYPEKTSVWVIGDIHGCGKQFKELLEAIHSVDDSDTVVYQLGDMIDRGPDLFNVYCTAEQYKVNLLIGNHEMNFLTEYDGFKKCNSAPRKVTHNQLSSMSEAQQQFVLRKMRTSLNYVEVMIGGQHFVMSHAPLHEHFSRTFVETMDVGNGWNYCTCNAPYPAEYGIDQETIYLHGHQHWNYRKIEDQISRLKGEEVSSLNVDSGCVYGKEAVAVRLNDYRVLRAKCDIDYS